MEVFTVEEFQDRWEEMIERVENGETFGIINEEGQATVMAPIVIEDPIIRIHYLMNNDGP